MPITAELEAKIIRHWKQHGQPNSAITSFRRALARTTIKLPKGRAAHSLRHTFASHFIQNGGNILTLQKILGHSSLAMTMRYAHWHRIICRMRCGLGLTSLARRTSGLPILDN